VPVRASGKALASGAGRVVGMAAGRVLPLGVRPATVDITSIRAFPAIMSVLKAETW
jgi:hypothetical protein